MVVFPRKRNWMTLQVFKKKIDQGLYEHLCQNKHLSHLFKKYPAAVYYSLLTFAGDSGDFNSSSTLAGETIL